MWEEGYFALNLIIMSVGGRMIYSVGFLYCMVQNWRNNAPQRNISEMLISKLDFIILHKKK